MPGVGAVPLRNAPEQGRDVVAQAHGRQPAFRRQLAPSHVLRVPKLHDHRAELAVDREAQAVHA